MAAAQHRRQSPRLAPVSLRVSPCWVSLVETRRNTLTSKMSNLDCAGRFLQEGRSWRAQRRLPRAGGSPEGWRRPRPVSLPLGLPGASRKARNPVLPRVINDGGHHGDADPLFPRCPDPGPAPRRARRGRTAGPGRVPPPPRRIRQTAGLGRAGLRLPLDLLPGGAPPPGGVGWAAYRRHEGAAPLPFAGRRPARREAVLDHPGLAGTGADRGERRGAGGPGGLPDHGRGGPPGGVGEAALRAQGGDPQASRAYRSLSLREPPG